MISFKNATTSPLFNGYSSFMSYNNLVVFWQVENFGSDRV